jgi:hypothetical protein
LNSELNTSVASRAARSAAVSARVGGLVPSGCCGGVHRGQAAHTVGGGGGGLGGVLGVIDRMQMGDGRAVAFSDRGGHEADKAVNAPAGIHLAGEVVQGGAGHIAADLHCRSTRRNHPVELLFETRGAGFGGHIEAAVTP